VAVRGSVLYFCIIEIAQVNWMYNSSLAQFLELYNYSIDNSPKTTIPLKDVENILASLTFNVYRYVNRGLFEKDKIIFLLMVCFKIQITDEKITSEDVSVFLKSGDALDKTDYKPKPQAEWLNEKMWTNILALSNHKFGPDQNQIFKNLPEQLTNQIDVWKKWAYEKMDPENYPIPEYEERIQNDGVLGMFLKLCLVRAIREDRVITTV
jgi:dynein heavy chain